MEPPPRLPLSLHGLPRPCLIVLIIFCGPLHTPSLNLPAHMDVSAGFALFLSLLLSLFPAIFSSFLVSLLTCFSFYRHTGLKYLLKTLHLDIFKAV